MHPHATPSVVRGLRSHVRRAERGPGVVVAVVFDCWCFLTKVLRLLRQLMLRLLLRWQSWMAVLDGCSSGCVGRLCWTAVLDGCFVGCVGWLCWMAVLDDCVGRLLRWLC